MWKRKIKNNDKVVVEVDAEASNLTTCEDCGVVTDNDVRKQQVVTEKSLSYYYGKFGAKEVTYCSRCEKPYTEVRWYGPGVTKYYALLEVDEDGKPVTKRKKKK